METQKQIRIRAWIWAIAVNLIVFAIIWMAFARIPAPVRSADGPDPNGGTEGTLSRIDHIMGDPFDQSSATEGDIPIQAPTAETEPSNYPEQWVDEFYLDRGPAISFAPRQNPDGTPRRHPTINNRVKAPTYEDQDSTFNSEDINPPIMTPQFFSILDLPEEYREMNFNMTVRVHLDTRGRVLGVPEIIRSSGHRAVDEIVINKLMNEVRFTAATRKDTGEPVSIPVNIPIFFENPQS